MIHDEEFRVIKAYSMDRYSICSAQQLPLI